MQIECIVCIWNASHHHYHRRHKHKDYEWKRGEKSVSTVDTVVNV